MPPKVTRTVARHEGSSPHNEVTAQALFNLPKGFEFDPTYRYVGALPVQVIHAYGTVDARLGWHFTKAFELSIDGQNLLQPHHAELSSVQLKRSAYAQITWNKTAK